MRFKILLGVAAAALTLAAAPEASAQSSVKVGSLQCAVSAGLGLIITSSKDIACTFTSARGWSEHYYGAIHKFGLDIGATDRGVLLWTVFAPTLGPRRHALAGDYAGADASVTVGAGVGANALVGGSNSSVALQPLSVQGQVGLNAAAGIGALELHLAQ